MIINPLYACERDYLTEKLNQKINAKLGISPKGGTGSLMSEAKRLKNKKKRKK